MKTVTSPSQNLTSSNGNNRCALRILFDIFTLTSLSIPNIGRESVPDPRFSRMKTLVDLSVLLLLSFNALADVVERFEVCCFSFTVE